MKEKNDGFAFVFFPGSYLRDTQCLSEKSQVAYDRIMCEHVRNICISKSQFKFFVKKLNNEEIEELMQVLTENEDGFQITWVADSINKYNNYRQSRSNNRKGKTKKQEENKNNHMENISKTYDKHMEYEYEDLSRFNLEKDKGGLGEKEKTNLPARMNAELTIQMSVTDNNRAHDVIDMQNNLPRGSGKKMAEIFLSMLDATGELQKHNPDDMGRYFINWANYHAKRLRPMLENAGNKSEVVSTYFEKTTGKQTPDEMLKSLHAYLK